jgi:hypothetical protein
MKPEFCCGAVAEDRLHGDVLVHIHHAAGLGHDGLLRVELDLDELHVVTVDLVVYRVHCVHGFVE